MKTFVVIVSLDNDNIWEIYIPEIQGFTQAESESDISLMAEEFISLDQNIPQSEIDTLLYIEDNFSNYNKIISGELRLV